MTEKIDHLILFIWVYIAIALPPFAIFFLLKFLSPESEFSIDLANKTLNFPTIVIAAFVLPSIGIILSIWRKKIKVVYFWNIEKHEKIHIAAISFILSVLLWQFFSVLYFLGYVGLIILFIFFLFYFPLANIYFSSINFNEIKRFIISDKKKTTLYIIENILFAIVVLLLIHIFVILLDRQIVSYSHYQLFLTRHPQIQSIKPKIVYYNSKIVLTGKNFGWGKNNDAKFMYKGGSVDITLWTDSKVIFTVPLHWKEGDITIWMQKPIEWDGGKKLIKSNMVTIELISRNNGWDKNANEYFEQLKHLDEETLELNGYK